MPPLFLSSSSSNNGMTEVSSTAASSWFVKPVTFFPEIKFSPFDNLILISAVNP